MAILTPKALFHRNGHESQVVPATVAEENKRLKQKNRNQRRALAQLHKAHVQTLYELEVARKERDLYRGLLRK